MIPAGRSFVVAVIATAGLLLGPASFSSAGKPPVSSDAAPRPPADVDDDDVDAREEKEQGTELILPLKRPLARRALPRKVDLTPHLPPIGDQGKTSACCAWATIYYAASLQHRATLATRGASAGAVPPPTEPFSPSYVFNIYKHDRGVPCNRGVQPYKLAETARRWGLATVDLFPSTPDCSLQPADAVRARAAQHRVRGVVRLFDNKGAFPFNNSVQVLKEKLTEGFAIVVGLAVAARKSGSTDDVKIKSYRCSDLPLEPPSKESWEKAGHHVQTIVGYDDQFGEGGFQLADSHGKERACKGFEWVSYSYAKRAIQYAYVVVLR